LAAAAERHLRVEHWEEAVNAPPEPNPTVARRRLAVRFQGLREQRGRSLKELASYLAVPEPQASRLDTGARGFNPGQIEKLAKWYNLDAAELPGLLAMGAESRRRGWWQQIELADSYRTLIGLEQIARSINEYGGAVVPGLLQTPDYARASARGGTIDAPPQQIEQAVEVRIRRQRILDGDDPPQLWVVIDEAVLARTTGGATVMGAQLVHLVEMSTRPQVNVQIVGFETGVHVGSSRNHFILIEMGDCLPDVLYREATTGPLDTTKVTDYWRAWNELRAVALDRNASRTRIQSYREKLHPPVGRADESTS
jgi:transcriptional regulator with XRE-family HTH domain